MSSIIPTDTMRLHFELEGDERAQVTLAKLEENILQTYTFLEGAKQIAIRDTVQHFMQEEDPEGDEWVYWADSYAAYAQEHNEGILRQEGTLFDAATDPDAYQIDANTLFVDTSKFPRYWAVHQYGELSKPSGVAMYRSKFYSGQPGAVPQRAFLGLSQEAADEMMLLAERWVDYCLDDAIDVGRAIPMGMVRGHAVQLMPGTERGMILGGVFRHEGRAITGQFAKLR